MARKPVAAIAADFTAVVTLLKDRGLLPPEPGKLIVSHARQIHADTFSLILWRFRLKGLKPHARVFVEEIASDSLQILPQILMGYTKTAKLLVRGIIENTFRHIYFADHPIEFLRMNREAKWFLTSDALFDYAKNHPDFLVTEPRFNAIAQLSSLHSDLSAGIHGRTVRDLEMRKSLLKIAYDEEAAKKEAELLRKCAAASNFLLAIFHRQQFRTFQADDKAIIIRTLPRGGRSVFAEHP